MTTPKAHATRIARVAHGLEARCSCGWKSGDWRTRGKAEQSARRHQRHMQQRQAKSWAGGIWTAQTGGTFGADVAGPVPQLTHDDIVRIIRRRDGLIA